MSRQIPPYWGYDPHCWPELPPSNSLRWEILQGLLSDELIQFSTAPRNADLRSAIDWLKRAGFFIEEFGNGTDPISGYGLRYFRALDVPDALRAHIREFYKYERKTA